jgi:MoaA/NifB/PqqE/SkfB family radical SAM enzyme
MILPVILTITVTDRCNSRCKTCNIWKVEVKPERECTVAEYEKIFNNFRHLFWVTIMGGEPFLRDDLFQIIKTLYEKTKPKFLTIPTNGILTDRISSVTKSILNSCANLNLIINLSMDGVGKKHDEIRGIEGNFEKLLKTFNELKMIDNPRLTVGINTVISKYNISFFSEIYEFIQKIKPDSYVVEIAENMAKLYNLNLEI